MPRKYKITGTLNGGNFNWDYDDIVQSKKILYARFEWTMLIKVFYMRLFYDWVEVEEVNE